jgi:hypothetical protein
MTMLLTRPDVECDRRPQVAEALASADTGDSRLVDLIDSHEALKLEATEELSCLMRRCQGTVVSDNQLPAIRAFLDGWTSIEADLVSRYGEAGIGAFWAGMRTATGRWIEQHPGAAGLPIVVDSGIVVDGLAAIVLAAAPGFPPLLRLNTSVMREGNRHAVIAWVERELASGRPVATLNTEDLRTLSGHVS